MLASATRHLEYNPLSGVIYLNGRVCRGFLGSLMRHCFAALSLLLISCFALAQDRSYGRSMVVTTSGIAATSHYLASQAGADVLRRGGSAIDAAIAANAVL